MYLATFKSTDGREIVVNADRVCYILPVADNAVRIVFEGADAITAVGTLRDALSQLQGEFPGVNDNRSM
jgi:hypothetical protein